MDHLDRLGGDDRVKTQVREMHPLVDLGPLHWVHVPVAGRLQQRSCHHEPELVQLVGGIVLALVDLDQLDLLVNLEATLALCGLVFSEVVLLFQSLSHLVLGYYICHCCCWKRVYYIVFQKKIRSVFFLEDGRVDQPWDSESLFL